MPDYSEVQFEDLYRTFGQRVTSARRGAGFTQAQLAAAVGLTRTSVANIEAGRQHPPLHVLLLIAGHLGIGLADLLAVDGATSNTLVVKLLAESAGSRRRAYSRGWDDCVAAMRQAVRTVALSRVEDEPEGGDA